MRRLAVKLGIVCLVVAFAACDVEQPTQSQVERIEVTLTAGSALVEFYDVWEWYVDADGDGVPDEFLPDGTPIDPPIQVRCKQIWPPVTEGASSVPWPFSVLISIIPGGTTQEIFLSTDEASASEFNIAPYDDVVLTGQPPPPCTPPEVCTPLGRRSSASRLVMESAYDDPFRQLEGEPVGLFRCPGAPGLGGPTLSGTSENPLPPPFVVSVDKGDTVIVRARKNLIPLGGLEVETEPLLRGFMTLDGEPVTPKGQTESTIEPGSGVTLSFTIR